MALIQTDLAFPTSATATVRWNDLFLKDMSAQPGIGMNLDLKFVGKVWTSQLTSQRFLSDEMKRVNSQFRPT